MPSVTDSRRVFECEQCGKLYFPIKPDSRFCSLSCARTRDHLLRNVDPDLKDELLCAIRDAVDRVFKK